MTTTKQNWKLLASAAMVSLALSGCGSDGKDGSNGEDGKPGPVGVHISQASDIKATFTDANIAEGVVTVDFTLENANGVGVYGLTKEHDLRFGMAQLAHVVEEDADRGYQWMAYINAEKQPNADWVPENDPDINPSAQFQAGVEKAGDCDECLVDNGDGTYSYTYQVNVADVTAPIKVAYDADLTHRATMELELPQTAVNAHYDWQPSTGNTDGIQTRNVVSIEACYTCHQPESLELHGGRRLDIENCASCHTYTSGDPESGNSVDFTYMIHAIHKGGERATVNEAGEEVAAPYKIVGYGGKVLDYGKVMYPQKPAADCAACHVVGEDAPANADLFKADMSNTACIACHSERPSKNHSSTNCMACHSAEGGYPGTGNAEKRHGDVLKAFDLAQEMSVSFSDIAVDASNVLSVKVQVLDKDGAAIDGQYINAGTRVIMAWDSDKDFPDYGDTSSYSKRRMKLEEGTYDAADKSYTIAFTNAPLPADVNGKTLELWSAVAVCFNNGGYGVADIAMTACDDTTRSIEVKDDAYHFVWNNGVDPEAEPAMRRAIVDAAKCQGCHNQEIFHYDNGVNCQTCHTSDKTTKSDSNYPGGKKPTSFAYKAHLASGHYLKYAGVQSGTVVKTDCSTCHATGSEDGIALGRAPERVWRYGDTATGADIWVSSDAGACLSCHQKYLGESGKAHITTFGGVLDGVDADDVRTRESESCATCHTPDQIRALHGN